MVVGDAVTFNTAKGGKLTGELIRENNKTVILKVDKSNSIVYHDYKHIKVRKGSENKIGGSVSKPTWPQLQEKISCLTLDERMLTSKTSFFSRQNDFNKLGMIKKNVDQEWGINAGKTAWLYTQIKNKPKFLWKRFLKCL